MDRKLFLITLWKKGIKPIILMMVIVIFLIFLYRALSENQTERWVLIVTLSLGLLFAVLHFVKEIFSALIAKTYEKSPISVQKSLEIAGDCINYLSPIVLGMILYHYWLEGQRFVVLLVGVLLVQRIIDIIKKKKKNEA